MALWSLKNTVKTFGIAGVQCMSYQWHGLYVHTYCMYIKGHTVIGHIVLLRLLRTWSPRPRATVSVCQRPGLWTARCSSSVKLTFRTTEIRSFWFVFVIRMPRDLPYFGRQRISIKTCIAWPWLVLVSTATSSVSTLCPNTLVLTRHFLKRLDL